MITSGAHGELEYLPHVHPRLVTSIMKLLYNYYYIKLHLQYVDCYNYKRKKKHFKNEQRSRDATAKKRANTSGMAWSREK